LKFVTSRKASNPLNPVYNLPKVEIKPPTPLKLLRDNLRTDDIEKCKSKQFVPPGSIARDTMNLHDIPGARSKPTTLTRRSNS
jgi:hypothetical protein